MERGTPALSAAAFAGFVDVALCCLFILRLEALPSLAWGLTGAAGGAALSLLIWRMTDEADGADDGLAERMERVHDNIDSYLDDGNPDPWWKRWGWNAVIVAGAAVAGALVVVLALSRSFVTILVFAFVAQSVSPWLVVAVFACSAALQLVTARVIGLPLAQKLGLSS